MNADDIQDFDRDTRFRQLRWSLQALAQAAPNQLLLFGEQQATADVLALDFTNAAAAVTGEWDETLTPVQRQALAAIDGKLNAMSRDGAEFDADLWTDSAVLHSEHWAEVRRLAGDALSAFDWATGPTPAEEESNV